jgi:pimeloyl-ACP methyl ester carboxylesterase
LENYHFVTYGEFTLPYRIYGAGPELMLAFHGFGREGSEFIQLAQFIGNRYTIYAFDLFYHGAHADSLDKELPPADASVMAHLVEKLLWEGRRVKFSVTV